MSRLGGSRWCLRRTGCAMGFEVQSGVQQIYGLAPEEPIRRMCCAAKNCRRVGRGEWERSWTSGEHTDASARRSTSSNRW